MNIIDLSQELDENTQVFPGDPNLKLLQWSNYTIQGYKSETIFTTSHIGTHIDAPSHFNPDGISVEKIPLEKTVILSKAKVLRIKKDDDEKINSLLCGGTAQKKAQVTFNLCSSFAKYGKMF